MDASERTDDDGEGSPVEVSLVFGIATHGVPREEVREMFFHAYNNYMEHAFPLDELLPLECTGRGVRSDNDLSMSDVYGNYSMSLVESISTLIVMGEYAEAASAVNHAIRHVSFRADATVQVFEVTIR